MRICVIFNPAAKGEKARRFRRHLDEIGAQSALKLTTGPGEALLKKQFRPEIRRAVTPFLLDWTRKTGETMARAHLRHL